MVIVQLTSPRWHGEVDSSNDRRNPSHRPGDEILESRKGILRPLHSRRIMLKMLWGSLLIWSVVSFLTNTAILPSFSFGGNRICPPQPLFGGGNIMEVGGIRRPQRVSPQQRHDGSARHRFSGSQTTSTRPGLCPPPR